VGLKAGDVISSVASFRGAMPWGEGAKNNSDLDHSSIALFWALDGFRGQTGLHSRRIVSDIEILRQCWIDSWLSQPEISAM
jgi:hypothetical protein